MMQNLPGNKCLNICTGFKRSSLIHPNVPLFVRPQGPLSYRRSWNIALRHQEWIQSHLRSKQGNAIDVVVAYFASNSPDLLLSMMGCMNIASSDTNIHLTPAMLNVRWTAREIARALKVHDGVKNKEEGATQIRSHLTLILCGKEFTQCAMESASIIQLDETQQNCGHYALAIPLPNFTSLPFLETLQNSHNGVEGMVDMHSDAIIMFTSGTSSVAKGVRLSHLSLFIQSFSKTAHPCDYSKKTRMLSTTVPFFHVGGLSSALAVILVGGSLIFPEQNDKVGFHSVTAIKSIREVIFSANTLVLVPAMLHSILCEVNRKSCEPSCFPSVRLLLIGGQSLSEAQLTISQQIFPNAKIIQTYACTEAGSSITFATLRDPTISQLSIIEGDEKLYGSKLPVPKGSFTGFAPPHVEIKIFEKNKEGKMLKGVSPHTVGVIGTRGAHIMTGYWSRGRDDENKSKSCRKINLSHGINQNGWFITNDLGYVDEKGAVYFCGRLNEVVRTGGESVFPLEVENILIRHSVVDSCAVFALPHSRFGECVCAAIVVKQDNGEEWCDSDTSMEGFESDLARDKLRQFCKTNQLSGFKSPLRVFILKDLPRNSSGKVLKYQLAMICGGLRKDHGCSTAIRSKL